MRKVLTSLAPHRRTEVVFSLVVLGVVVGAVGFAEAVLRLREDKQFDWGELSANVMRYDAETGMERYIPGATYGSFSVNAIGLRGPEVAVPKPAGTLRLAYLGDSVVLGAALAQSETLSELVSAEVRKIFPECSVDYITVAGPSYSFHDISVKLSEIGQVVEPDAYVLVTGNFLEALRALQASAAPVVPYLKAKDDPLLDLLLWEKISYRYHAASDMVSFAQKSDLLDRIDIDRFAAVYRSLLDPLLQEIKGAPVAVVTYRGEERAGMETDQLAQIYEAVLRETNNLSLEGMIKLRKTMDAELAAVARAHDWVLGDPIAQLPPTAEFYLDRLHLTTAADRMLAAPIAGLVAAAIRNKGLSCRNDPAGSVQGAAPGLAPD